MFVEYINRVIHVKRSFDFPTDNLTINDPAGGCRQVFRFSGFWAIAAIYDLFGCRL